MNKKLLVVDDDPRILEVISTYMCDEFDIETASDGNEAIEEIQKDSPDLIVLDVMMPKKNGYDVTKWLKTKRQYNSIPIVMLTALDSDIDKQSGYRVGADKYITKPFALPELKIIIEKTLKEHEKKKAEGRLQKISFDMRSEVKYIQEINELISTLYVNTDMTEIEIEDIRFILNEVISNAVEHGNKSNREKLVRINAEIFHDKLVVEIEDEGEGFKEENLLDPTSIIEKLKAGEKVFPEIEERNRPGGWGIYMIKAMADEVEFNERGNKVKLTKYFQDRSEN